MEELLIIGIFDEKLQATGLEFLVYYEVYR
jgi:hypothetical protein